MILYIAAYVKDEYRCFYMLEYTCDGVRSCQAFLMISPLYWYINLNKNMPSNFEDL